MKYILFIGIDLLSAPFLLLLYISKFFVSLFCSQMKED